MTETKYECGETIHARCWKEISNTAYEKLGNKNKIAPSRASDRTGDVRIYACGEESSRSLTFSSSLKQELYTSSADEVELCM